MIDILSLNKDKLQEHIISMYVEKYRANQIFTFLHKHRIDNFEKISVIKKEFREILKKNFYIPKIECAKETTSQDKTIKYLFKLGDGQKIETVLIPMKDNRYTICVSTQVGCKMGCKFCATGKMGFTRNLTTSEILLQIYYILNEQQLNHVNIVYMGMGEPLDNYDNVVNSIKILIDEDGSNISKRRITLSTCGLIEKIEKLKKDLPNINIALSLHSAIDEKRSKLMPINQTHKLIDVMESLKTFPLPRRKRITFEYIMIKGVNDTKEDKTAILRLLSNYKSKLNIIPLNIHDLIDTEFEPTPRKEIENFAEFLRSKGMFVTIRDSKGSQIDAACGMLAAKNS
jgi:23S rRNA (adenine2503-C2)-methyltransferase